MSPTTGGVLSGLFGGPLSTRSECEDSAARASILQKALREREKAEAAARRSAGSGQHASGTGRHATGEQRPKQIDPKVQKRKKLESDLDAFDELNEEGIPLRPTKRRECAKAAPGGGERGQLKHSITEKHKVQRGFNKDDHLIM